MRGSTTGTAFTDLAAPVGYVFNPADANAVTIAFPTAVTRYLRLQITGNTAQPGGQVAEFEVFGPGPGQGAPDLTRDPVGNVPLDVAYLCGLK